MLCWRNAKVNKDVLTGAAQHKDFATKVNRSAEDLLCEKDAEVPQIISGGARFDRVA
jgi:hypothetical protein